LLTSGFLGFGRIPFEVRVDAKIVRVSNNQEKKLQPCELMRIPMIVSNRYSLSCPRSQGGAEVDGVDQYHNHKYIFSINSDCRLAAG
jgi:hypothetical protein